MMQYIRTSSIASKKIQDTWVIISQDGKYSYELNESAGVLWEALSKPRTTAQLEKVLRTSFECPEDAASQDITEFLDMYVSRGLVKAW